jgi:hypothetical protein
LYLLERARERQRDREREEEAEEEEEEEAYLDALLRITVLPGEALIFFFFFSLSCFTSSNAETLRYFIEIPYRYIQFSAE